VGAAQAESNRQTIARAGINVCQAEREGLKGVFMNSSLGIMVLVADILIQL
jgi:hypothetical protein